MNMSIWSLCQVCPLAGRDVYVRPTQRIVPVIKQIWNIAFVCPMLARQLSFLIILLSRKIG